MFVECCKNNGTDYLRLVKSQRILNAKGFKTVRKMIVFNIGPLSRYDDGKPDYVERLKKSYKCRQARKMAGKQACKMAEKWTFYVKDKNVLSAEPKSAPRFERISKTILS